MSNINKIIVSGCSYSEQTPYSDYIDTDIEIKNISVSGQSNDSIIKKIYDYITIFDSNRNYYICQLTYLHRWGFYHQCAQRWLDYQPNMVNKIRQLTDGVQIDTVVDIDNTFFNRNMEEVSENIVTFDEWSDLQKMYQSYLKYAFDETTTFHKLMMQVDMLKEYVKSKGSEIIFIYWPEIVNTPTKAWELSNLEYLQSHNFFNIGGNYSMLDHTIRHNLTIEDTHLNEAGAREIGNALSKEIKKIM